RERFLCASDAIPATRQAVSGRRSRRLRPSEPRTRVGAEWLGGRGRMSAPHDPSVAAADPSRSAWVAAHAGAGKTHTLANRVTRLLLADADPAKILCL